MLTYLVTLGVLRNILFIQLFGYPNDTGYFDIECAIFYINLHELLSVHKLNKLGKFW